MNRVEAIKMLDSLGGTVQEVAQSLKDKGITGARRNPCHCPLANLIGGYVDNQEGFVGLEEGFELNRPCRDFVLAFDNGLYPELEQGPVWQSVYMTNI